MYAIFIFTSNVCTFWPEIEKNIASTPCLFLPQRFVHFSEKLKKIIASTPSLFLYTNATIILILRNHTINKNNWIRGRQSVTLKALLRPNFHGRNPGRRKYCYTSEINITQLRGNTLFFALAFCRQLYRGWATLMIETVTKRDFRI